MRSNSTAARSRTSVSSQRILIRGIVRGFEKSSFGSKIGASPRFFMPLLTLAGAELHYGDLPLLDRAALAVEAGERIGLIGRNGTGKSSLLGVLAGTLALDEGELKKQAGLKIVRVEQEPVVPANSTVEAHKLEKYLHLFGLYSD